MKNLVVVGKGYPLVKDFVNLDTRFSYGRLTTWEVVQLWSKPGGGRLWPGKRKPWES